MSKKTAFIALIGRANVGKSTLLNALIKEKISIVSKKPQTTRTKITGILTENEKQYIFIDTPGIHIPKSLLGKYMTKSANSIIGDADVAVLLVEPIKSIGKTERTVIEKLSAHNIPVILVVNKIDTIEKPEILEIMAAYMGEYKFDSIIPLSALNSDGTEALKSELDKYLVESEFFFPEDISTDQTERQIVAEVIREKALRLLDDEIPHGIAVTVEQFKDHSAEVTASKKNLISVNATILCEREGHKHIIIGKGGNMIKKIGTYAREDLEEFFGTKFFLDLWVKVKENWRDRKMVLDDIGYSEKDL